MLRTEGRLQRAIYRAIKNCKSVNHPEVANRSKRILIHAERLGWIGVPSAKDLGLPIPFYEEKDVIKIQVKPHESY